LKILLVSHYDPNAQGQMLTNYLRKHTKHKAKHVVMREFYLGYPRDELNPNFKFDSIPNEYKDYDFYIFRTIDNFFIRNWLKRGVIRPDNFIVKFHGSEVRGQAEAWRAIWEDSYRYGKGRIMFVTNGFDYTMSEDLPFSAAHIPPMVDADLLWEVRSKAQLKNDSFTVGHAPTDPFKKQTTEFSQAVIDINKKNKDVFGKVITQSPWKETIAEKASCHVIYDQMSAKVGIGAFGVNMIEALAMSQPVIGRYNGWALSWLPELEQVVDVPREISSAGIRQAIESIYADFKKGKYSVGLNWNPAGRKLVKERFDVPVVGKQWEHLIRFVAEGNK
jgi:hypothetical protein